MKKITRKAYDKAKGEFPRLEEKLADSRAIIETWESALSTIGNLGNQKVVAVRIAEDGTITTECEANGHPVAVGDEDRLF